ncbi:MAG: alanine--tRNA ligase [Candidatus Magasanikbacteria bacterium]|nr:alanine--tRNA ligase [Candidatus Magasanikbacteria bacterium]
MNTNELREKYLEFFKGKGHQRISSASLLPENDPTTLFTSSGMQPMVPYLLGEKHPLGVRITNSQKCFRTQDIEEVGDNRHTTFFEMLGNWSLGDYFKEEQISWFFEFITKVVGLDPDRIYVTVFQGKENLNIPRDEKSAKIWQELFVSAGVSSKIVGDPEFGMQNGRIFYYDESKNWWSMCGKPEKMPVGQLGGPDTEVFWDFGEELGLHKKSHWAGESCHPNCDCGRFMEIGNNVFMEYIKTNLGFELLPQKNVDFGGGLERIMAAKNNVPDVFLIDIFDKMRQTLERLSGKNYSSAEVQESFRVIMDHLRAATFLISDGACPSNKDQGYFTRRLVRRAVRFANKIGIEGNFCGELADSVINYYITTYPELSQNKDTILSELLKEEEKFRKTLQTGLKILRTQMRVQDPKSGQKLDFVDVSDGYVPTKLDAKFLFNMYQTYGFDFEASIEEIKQLPKRSLLQNEIENLKNGFNEELKKHQELSRKGAEQKFKGGMADDGEMSIKYHTATHLLHSALREVLGDRVEQKGSNITSERLRFDFSHSEKLTEEEIQKVERFVNKAIESNLQTSFKEMVVEEAKSQGAIGLFGDRYGDKVKVYTIGDGSQIASKEICGGPHVESTGGLGKFRIKKQESVSAGVRRIKAILE